MRKNLYTKQIKATQHGEVIAYFHVPISLDVSTQKLSVNCKIKCPTKSLKAFEVFVKTLAAEMGDVKVEVDG